MGGLPPERPINANDTQIEDFTPVPGGPGNNIDYWQTAGDHFFETMGIRLVEGRFFDARDVDGGTPSVIINRTMARTYYGDQSPVGRRVRPGFQDPWRTIVGVVEDVKNAGLDKPAGTELFLPYRQGSKVMPDDALSGLADRARSEVVDFAGTRRGERHRSVVAACAGPDYGRSAGRGAIAPAFPDDPAGLVFGTALVLAAVGLYGVISYSVTRRTTSSASGWRWAQKRSDVLGLVLAPGFEAGSSGGGGRGGGCSGSDAFDPRVCCSG